MEQNQIKRFGGAVISIGGVALLGFAFFSFFSYILIFKLLLSIIGMLALVIGLLIVGYTLNKKD